MSDKNIQADDMARYGTTVLNPNPDGRADETAVSVARKNAINGDVNGGKKS